MTSGADRTKRRAGLTADLRANQRVRRTGKQGRCELPALHKPIRVTARTVPDETVRQSAAFCTSAYGRQAAIRQHRQDLDGRHFPVVIIGGGQAGLSMSYHLQRRGIGHVVIEAKTAGHDWTDRRWDSFCLVTPNWQCRLPGYAVRGRRPGRFHGARRHRRGTWTAIVEHYNFPLVEQTTVTRLQPGRHERQFHAQPARPGQLTADQVVVATGPYQAPRTPRLAERLPEDVTQLHSAELPQPGGPARRRRPRRRHRPVGLPDRGGPAPGRAPGAPRGGRRDPGGPAVPGPRRRRLARADRLLQARRSPSSRRRTGRACTGPTSTSPAGTAATTSTCGRSPPRGCGSTGA